jgi:hypothetical protein
MVNFKTVARGNSRDTSDTLVMLLFLMGDSDVDGPGHARLASRGQIERAKSTVHAALLQRRGISRCSNSLLPGVIIRFRTAFAVAGIETRKAMKTLSLLVMGVAVLVAGVAVATLTSPAKADEQKCGWSNWPAPSPVPCGKQWAKSFEDCRKWMIDHGDTNVVAAWYCHSQGHTQ